MLQLDYRDARPIYEQVKEGLRRMVIVGAIAQGEQLPSVRNLARSLAINPNTIQRAYDSLENEGYIYSQPGRGTFACSPEGVDEGRKEGLLTQFDQVTTELLYLQVSPEVLIGRVQEKGGMQI